MKKFQSLIRICIQFSAALLGVGLLAYLIFRTGPALVWNQVRTVGWGLALVIILGGFSQLTKTLAWRQTFTCDISKLSWPRSFGVQLVSDAAGQLGFAGKLLGEGLRVTLLGPAVPLTNGISAAAIDGGVHTLTAAVVTVLGIATTLVLAPVSGKWRLDALLLAGVLIVVVILAAVGVASRFPLVGNAVRMIGRWSRVQNFIGSKQPIIDSAEHNLLTFHSQAPAAFWASVTLNFLGHSLAILEVYVILRFMGAKIAVISAFVLEALTKVINLVGVFNPGNIGTYEGGTMLITKLLGVAGTTGLTLALCRRARAIFWAGAGAVCMILMRRPSSQDKIEVSGNFDVVSVDTSKSDDVTTIQVGQRP